MTERFLRPLIRWAGAMALACLAILAVGSPLGAQPSDRPVKIIVGFPAGGGLDIMVRTIAEKMRAATGATIIIENRPGAAGRIAAEAVARAEPDGATILAAPIVATAFYPFIFKSLPFDPLKDLAPITRFSTFQFALAIGRQVPAANAAEFIAFVRANPGKAGFGSLGAGTPSHFLGIMFNQATGLDLTHVPYRGSAPALNDLVGGSLQAVFDTTASLMEHHKAGTARLLAVTGRTRSPRLPDVPTFAELQLGLGDMETAELWYGFFAPGRTPAAMIDGWNAAIRAALADPAVRAQLERLDVQVVSDTPAEFSAIIAADYERWGRVIRATGFTMEDAR